MAAPERSPASADHEDNEGLRGKRFDEPAGSELGRVRVQEAEHYRERQEIEDGAEWTEEDHETADEAEIPRRRSGQHLLVDVIGRDRHLTAVVQQVVREDLHREHRQEFQEG